MTEANKSLLGFAKQAAKGTPNTTDAAFKYLRFLRGAAGPQSVFLPTEPEVGGSPLTGDVIKAGVMSNGAVEFIPRSDTLGALIYAALGSHAVVADGLGYKHTNTLDSADQFNQPYYTFRSSPGKLIGEQLQDCRVNALSLNWKGANFLRAQMGFVGGLPDPVETAAWAPVLDNGPLFIAPVSSITWPAATVKVLGGSFSIGAAVPMDEQWIVGSYSPDDFNIVQRQIAIQLLLKISDKTLYEKMQYDAAAGGAWAASILKEAGVTITMQSTSTYDTAKPHKVVIKANGSATAPNVAWTCQQIGMEAGKQIKLAATGMYLASSDGEDVTVEVYNDIATY